MFHGKAGQLKSAVRARESPVLMEEEEKLSDMSERDGGLSPAVQQRALFTQPLRRERRGEMMEARGWSIRLQGEMH